jgi:hypothetical protein
MLERFGPSAACATRGVGFDRERLMHCQLGLARQVGERHSRDHFVALVLECSAPYDPLRRDDLASLTLILIAPFHRCLGKSMRVRGSVYEGA